MWESWHPLGAQREVSIAYLQLHQRQLLSPQEPSFSFPHYVTLAVLGACVIHCVIHQAVDVPLTEGVSPVHQIPFQLQFLFFSPPPPLCVLSLSCYWQKLSPLQPVSNYACLMLGTSVSNAACVPSPTPTWGFCKWIGYKEPMGGGAESTWVDCS